MKKFFSGFSWASLAAAFLCFLGILQNRRQAERIFSHGQVVWTQSDRCLLLAMGIALLLGGVFYFYSRSKKSILFWIPFAIALCAFVWRGLPVLRDQESGTIAEAIDRHISSEATIKEGEVTVIKFQEDSLSNVSTALSDQEIERLEELFANWRYSFCIPDEILQREHSFSCLPVNMPTIRLKFHNPADRSCTYYLNIYCDNPHDGLLYFHTSSNYASGLKPIFCRLESPELYTFIQDRMDRMVVLY